MTTVGNTAGIYQPNISYVMRHTDFTEKLNHIKAIEIQELRSALEDHGGRYRWPLHEGPIILAETNEIAEVFAVEDVRLTESGEIEVSGHWRDETRRMPHSMRFASIWTDDIPVGHVSAITECLPDIGI